MKTNLKKFLKIFGKIKKLIKNMPYTEIGNI